MENTIINKVSETEGEIIETIPQEVIPAKEVKRTVTIKQLKAELSVAKANLEGAKKSKQFDVDLYTNAINIHDAIIAEKKAIKDKIVAQIDALKAQGITEPVEEVLPVNEVII